MRLRWAIFKHDADRKFTMWLCTVSRKLPRKLRYWVVVTAACDTTDSYPGDVTAHQMLDTLA